MRPSLTMRFIPCLYQNDMKTTQGASILMSGKIHDHVGSCENKHFLYSYSTSMIYENNMERAKKGHSEIGKPWL